MAAFLFISLCIPLRFKAPIQLNIRHTIPELKTHTNEIVKYNNYTDIEKPLATIKTNDDDLPKNIYLKGLARN